MKPILSQMCPCHSKKCYQDCCEPYHQGAFPKTALALMRSRYSAYALGLAHYVIETIHLDNPSRGFDQKQWLYQIQAFCQQVNFEGLTILETTTFETETFVIFIAYLSKQGVDLTFTEKSRFLKQDQVWKYRDCKMSKGCLTAEQMNVI